MTARMVAAIEHPWIDAIGHPTGRKIAHRAPYGVDVDALIEAAARTGTMIEINGAPDRRDLNDVHARAAAEAGVPILIDSDGHGVEALRHVKWAVATARRAWLGPEQIANTRPWPEFAGLRKRATAPRGGCGAAGLAPRLGRHRGRRAPDRAERERHGARYAFDHAACRLATSDVHLTDVQDALARRGSADPSSRGSSSPPPPRRPRRASTAPAPRAASA